MASAGKETFTYLILCIVSMLACVGALVSFLYAEYYADYLVVKRALPVGRTIETVSFYDSLMHKDILNRYNLMFFAPALVVIANRYTISVAHFWTVFSVLLLILCHSFIGSDGDSKGCTDCEILIFYVLLIPLPFIICFFYGLAHWSK